MQKQLNHSIIYILLLLILPAVSAFAQKKVSELTLVYEAIINTGSTQPKIADAFDGSTTTVYIKGSMTRSEMVSSLASSTTIHDSHTGTAVILQDVGGQKLLIKMTPDDWKDKNKEYDDINFSNTKDTKTIAGYKCNKATATMKDGAIFTVYYTPDLLPENSDYSYQFKKLNGLPLQFILKKGALQITYTVSSVSLNPVPASKFDIPQSGYREMTYEESKQLGK